MAFNLRNRSYLTELDFTKEELLFLLDLAAQLKSAAYAGIAQNRLVGKHLALIFEKASTRTRCAFEVAAAEEGATTTYLGPQDAHLGHKESARDTARVLGRMYDGIEYRGHEQATVEELARYSGVPVYNGLTATSHPTQSLCDVFTMREHSTKPLPEIAFCYLGDTRNNVARSLLAMGAKLGMDVRLAGPRALWPDEEYLTTCLAEGAVSGARITVTDDVEEAVTGADFLHTDVWVSMGEPAGTWHERVALLAPYQVTAKTLGATGNPGVRFLHCLPALHDRETEVGAEAFEEFGLDGVEVTDDVFESPASLVFEQAENRMHTIKAILVATLGS
ncbi:MULTISPECIES: ornithine carbamoyltransferase [Amycolatopsis]|uniref:ornithine carbamoyltransferase n=1 Tax=Amycolatopsis TaxID=1813 RepID=UPI001C564050|nr:ornithine carbamoyltransferase [Amycolatopsis sp. TNS106]QXV56492.1 ornithine carbamoyltransferase [Amycolatopsis sp. TNS106]